MTDPFCTECRRNHPAHLDCTIRDLSEVEHSLGCRSLKMGGKNPEFCDCRIEPNPLLPHFQPPPPPFIGARHLHYPPSYPTVFYPDGVVEVWLPKPLEYFHIPLKVHAENKVEEYLRETGNIPRTTTKEQP